MKKVGKLGQELGRAFKRARQMSEIPALTGIVRDNGTISLVGDDAHNDRLPANQVYVRLYGQQSQTRVAWAAGIAARPNVPVVVSRNYNGQWRLVGIDDQKASRIYGDRAGSMAQPRVDGTVNPLRVSGSNLTDARVYPIATDTLEVTAEPFRYLDSAGDDKTWLGESGGTVMLVPPTTFGVHRWSVVAFNPDATTPALADFYGADVDETLDLDESDVDAVAVTAGYLRLEAFDIGTDDTALREAMRARIPVRRLMNDVPVAGGGGGGGSPTYPIRATLWHDESTMTVGSGLSSTTDSGSYYNVLTLQTSPADGDTTTLSFFVAAGTYTLSVMGRSSTDRGKVDWYIDGVLAVAGQDWYSASSTANVVKTASVTVATDGPHQLRGVMNGKNGSSSNYYLVINKLWLKQTAD